MNDNLINKNVLIAYHYIAHYRVPIFNLLSKSSDPNYTIMAGIKTEVAIKTANEDLANMPLIKGGLRWIKIKNYWLFKFFLFQPAVIRASFSKKYDTIIYLGVMYYPSTWIAAIAAKITKKKVIFWTHGFIRDEKSFQNFIRGIFYSLADEILVYGQWAKDILIRRGFDKNKITLIYNSLDYDQQILIRNSTPHLIHPSSLFKNAELPVFGFIGRLTKQKKIDMLLDVLSALNEQRHPANLLIIGDGDQMNVLKQKAKELSIEDNVCFYGSCYDEPTIFQLMQLMNVIVSPGEVGLTAMHSLAYGVPVITHGRFDRQMPEYAAIIDDFTGAFFDYERPDESLLEVLKVWLFKKDKKDNQKNCYQVIDDYYNPYVQKKIFDSVVI